MPTRYSRCDLGVPDIRAVVRSLHDNFRRILNDLCTDLRLCNRPIP
jgi:hypothetical protein